ncbi:HAD-like hydrolase family protein [Gracilaria domingensis]|nr:HAD-like hydrolase family protein [Gracilaria domingensis]
MAAARGARAFANGPAYLGARGSRGLFGSRGHVGTRGRLGIVGAVLIHSFIHSFIHALSGARVVHRPDWRCSPGLSAGAVHHRCHDEERYLGYGRRAAGQRAHLLSRRASNRLALRQANPPHSAPLAGAHGRCVRAHHRRAA